MCLVAEKPLITVVATGQALGAATGGVQSGAPTASAVLRPMLAQQPATLGTLASALGCSNNPQLHTAAGGAGQPQTFMLAKPGAEAATATVRPAVPLSTAATVAVKADPSTSKVASTASQPWQGPAPHSSVLKQELSVKPSVTLAAMAPPPVLSALKVESTMDGKLIQPLQQTQQVCL